MTPEYDFETLPVRTGTGSLKWDKYKGRSVLPFWVADMDFLSAPEIIAALRDRVEHGVFGYTIPYDSVVEAVLEYLQGQHGFAVQSDELVWLPGLVPAINLCCQAFTEPTEAVMTCSPVYPPFLTAPVNATRPLIHVPLVRAEERWTFDFEALEAAVTPATRLFILCSPHNPVGRVFSKEELKQLGEFCIKHDLILISDEIHCDLIFDEGVRHTVTATISPELADRTITLMAPSKTYNLPGLACAYAVIQNRQLRARFNRVARGVITEINAFGYVGCEAAYRFGEPWRQALLAKLRSNHELLLRWIRDHLPEITFHPMEGTYLAWLDISALGLEQPCTYFESQGIGLSDGTPFGDSRYLRLNFGCPTSHLQEGLRRLTEAVHQLR